MFHMHAKYSEVAVLQIRVPPQRKGPFCLQVVLRVTVFFRRLGRNIKTSRKITKEHVRSWSPDFNLLPALFLNLLPYTSILMFCVRLVYTVYTSRCLSSLQSVTFHSTFVSFWMCCQHYKIHESVSVHSSVHIRSSRACLPLQSQLPASSTF